MINFDILFKLFILDGSTLLMKAEMFKTEIPSQQLLWSDAGDGTMQFKIVVSHLCCLNLLIFKMEIVLCGFSVHLSVRLLWVKI